MFRALVLLLIGIHGAFGSHFRGGSMSWKAISDNKIELTYHVSYKFYHKEVRFVPCTVEAAEAQALLPSGGQLVCDGCVSGETKRNMDYVCSSYDQEQDWAIGDNKVIYTVPPGQSKFSISYQSCCWLRVVSPDTGRGARAWNMQTDVDVTLRPDGKINSSPVTGAIPIEKYRLGCTYNLQIAVSDPDNDIIKCKNFESDECHSDPGKRRACGQPTRGLTVNKDCTLDFDASVAGEGAHAVNIMIKDCPNKKCKKPYSKVPLLFLLNVTGDSGECIKPSIIIPPACNTIPPNLPFEMDIVAEAGDESKPISRISSSQPRGMAVSPMQAVEGSTIRKAITLSWKPTDADIGEHSLCFSALDSDGFTSGRYCTFLRVSDQPPLVADLDASTPAREAEHGTNEKWTIRFNQEIQRPSKPASIRIVSESGEEVYTVSSTSSKVTFSGDSIEFTPPQDTFGFAFTPTPYTLYLDEGVAIPAAGGCGSGAAEGIVYMKDNAAFAILPKQHCMSSSGPSNSDQQCDIFLKERLPDGSGGPGVPTEYNLCCNCYDGPPGAMMYAAAAPGHGPPGLVRRGHPGGR